MPVPPVPPHIDDIPTRYAADSPTFRGARARITLAEVELPCAFAELGSVARALGPPLRLWRGFPPVRVPSVDGARARRHRAQYFVGSQIDALLGEPDVAVVQRNARKTTGVLTRRVSAAAENPRPKRSARRGDVRREGGCAGRPVRQAAHNLLVFLLGQARHLMHGHDQHCLPPSGYREAPQLDVRDRRTRLRGTETEYPRSDSSEVDR